MKAVHVEAAGGPERLQYGDRDDPVPGLGDVIVQVRTAGVNHADIWLREGMLGPLPLIPGIDAAGTVVELGEQASGIALGARVVLNPVVTCDRCVYCLAGRHGLCRQKSTLGQRRDGSYAEYVRIPSANVHAIADDLSFEDAAALPSVFFTAWHVLRERADLKAGETILVTGAASGVGSAAIQIARLFGAEIIAAASTDRKLARTREWGAGRTINYRQDDLAAQVLDMTDGEGVDVILDIVGAALWGDYQRCIRPGGRIATCSFVSGDELKASIMTLISRQVTILGSGPQGSKSVAGTVVDLANRRRLRGVIDRILPLHDAAKAHAALEDRDVIGKILLIP